MFHMDDHQLCKRCVYGRADITSVNYFMFFIVGIFIKRVPKDLD